MIEGLATFLASCALCSWCTQVVLSSIHWQLKWLWLNKNVVSLWALSVLALFPQIHCPTHFDRAGSLWTRLSMCAFCRYCIIMLIVNLVHISPCSQSKSCFVLIFCYQELVDNKVADGIRPHLLIMICCLRVAAGDISQCDHQHRLEHINHLISLVPTPLYFAGVDMKAWGRGHHLTYACVCMCLLFLDLYMYLP